MDLGEVVGADDHARFIGEDARRRLRGKLVLVHEAEGQVDLPALPLAEAQELPALVADQHAHPDGELLGGVGLGLLHEDLSSHGVVVHRLVGKRREVLRPLERVHVVRDLQNGVEDVLTHLDLALLAPEVVELRPQDRVTIITYASGEKLVLPPTPGSNKEAILSVVNALQGFRYVFLLFLGMIITKHRGHLLEEEGGHKALVQKSIGIILIFIGTVILFI